MRRVYALASALIAGILLLAGCGNGPATTAPTTTTRPATTTPGTTTPPTTTRPTTEAPKYGGTVTMARAGDILGFDEGFQAVFFTVTNHLTHDEPLTGDWAKGPAGTNQYSWLSNGNYSWESKGGSVAESWEIKAPGHIVFKIRQGIDFGLNQNSEASRLVAGRELTGDDVFYTINRMLTLPTSYWRTAARTWTDGAKVNQIDKWTVEVTCAPADAYNFAAYLVDWCSIIPKEVITKYGDMRDWKNSVGSGPFFLTDFISNSSATFVKNPEYWRTDPAGPGKGNQLPYVDGVKILIIPDVSTRISAMRTGKVDILTGQTFDDATSLRTTVKELVELSYVPQSASHINMRTDKQDLPYKDKRVRHALMMATDFNTIIEELMGGAAQAQSWPITPMPDFKNAYLPLNEAPAAVQELYKYNPTKAKALLAEAGYPSGFKARIMYDNTLTFNSDYMSIVKQMWAQVGVELSLEPLEFVAYNNRWNGRNYDDLFYGLMASSGTYRRATNYAGVGAGWNLSYIDDPKTIEARDKMLALFNAGDDAGADKVNKEFMAYLLEQAYVLPTPVQNVSSFWWPWVKGYHGELSPGIINEWQEAMYLWIDQDLKRQMGR